MRNQQNMNYKIAVITPTEKQDYLTNTILDGLMQLKKEYPDLSFFTPTTCQSRLPVSSFLLPREKFVKLAHKADIILLFWGKNSTDLKLAHALDRWNKTVFIDGSEVGRNRRYNFIIQKEILEKKYNGFAAINKEMLDLCPLYFRREKPYINGIIPLSFGIELNYVKHYSPRKKKDIDFVCIFGQDEYPLMRRYVKELLVKYCDKNKFSYRVDKTDTPDEFYKLLSRAKAGISVGGGGYDTVRFWEILGNNCLLLTERIDIFQPDSKALDYERIWQFSNLYDFWYQLQKVGEFLRSEYNQENLAKEYKDILLHHSSKARVLKILEEARSKEIIS